MLKLSFVLQFKVESERHSICARSALAFPGCFYLAMGTLSANLSPSPIFVFVHCSAGARHKRTGRAYGTVRDYWLLFLASIVVPQPLSSYAGVPEGGGAGMDSKEGHSTRPIRERRFEDRKGRLHRRPKGKRGALCAQPKVALWQCEAAFCLLDSPAPIFFLPPFPGPLYR